MSSDPKRIEAELVRRAAEYRDQVKRWIRQIWNIELDDDFATTDDFKNAEAFYQQFTIEEEVDYEQVVSYAQKLYDSYEKQDRSLDDKADAVVKYLGGGSAIITIGALLSLKTDTWQTCLIGAVALVSLIPSLCFAVLAVRAAIRVRHPRLNSTLNPISYAVAIAAYHKTAQKISIKLWLQLHAICEGYHFRNIQKAKHVADAYTFYSRSIFCLGIPLSTVLAALVVLGIVAAVKPTPVTPPASTIPAAAPTK